MIFTFRLLFEADGEIGFRPVVVEDRRWYMNCLRIFE
jgi:hypothetical protein